MLEELACHPTASRFAFEGRKRLTTANIAIEKINEFVPDFIVIKNEKILEKIDKKMTVNEAFSIADDKVIETVENIK